MNKNDIYTTSGQSYTETTVRGEGNNKPMAKRVALRRAKKAAGGKEFKIIKERYAPQAGPEWWCFLTIRF